MPGRTSPWVRYAEAENPAMSADPWCCGGCTASFPKHWRPRCTAERCGPFLGARAAAREQLLVVGSHLGRLGHCSPGLEIQGCLLCPEHDGSGLGVHFALTQAFAF